MMLWVLRKEVFDLAARLLLLAGQKDDLSDLEGVRAHIYLGGRLMNGMKV